MSGSVTRREALLAATAIGMAAAVGGGIASSAHAQAASSAAPDAVSPEEAQAIAQEAYIYFYPLITMDVTRKQLINLDPKVSPMGGPPNAFTHIRAFPTADMRAVVRPNFDTLYSSGWLDLTGGRSSSRRRTREAATSCCR